MVRKLFLFWILLCTVFAWSAPLQYLIRTTPTATALDSTSGATIWNPTTNNAWREAAIGFDFPFNGSTYNAVRINSNGMLYFDLTSEYTTGSNVALPNAAGAAAQSIYPYWDQMYPALILSLGINGDIRYQTLGTGDSQRFVVTWSNIPADPVCLLGLCSKFNFQVVLYKNGDIRFRYPGGTLDGTNGSGATIGVQENTTNYDQYSGTINQTFDILYSTKPLISKTSIVTSDPANGTTNPKRIPGATVRYCFTVDNTGLLDATSVILTEDFTTNNKDKLTYVNSGFVVQNITTSCDCAGITNTSGSFSTPTVTINIGTLTGSTSPSTSRGCAYIEATIN
ncbi:MAG: hypothetical protein RBR33_07550 [Sulfurovaceae bacterium]|nr:hypothetical protein [Sulfurovaceae bacterium]